MSTALTGARDELVARAGVVAAVLREHAAETEELGRPAQASVTALREAGLLALTVPSGHGGAAAGFGTQARVAMELGRGCPSTAWVASLSAAAKSNVGSMLGEQARAAFYADPSAVVCASGVGGGRAVRRADGIRVSGTWKMASGCEIATWASLVVSGLDDRQQVVESGLVLVPVADLRIEPSWRSAGLYGTGSHALVAEDVLVRPESALLGPIPANPGPPPARVTLGAIVAHLAPMVGATAGALDAVRVMFDGDRVPFATTYARIVESPMARHWFARAERAVHAAVRDTLAVADRLDEGEPSDGERSGLRMDLVGAGAACRRAMEDLLDLRGSGGFSPGEPLQRFWRDVAVGTRYAGLNPYITVEDHARVLLEAGAPVSML